VRERVLFLHRQRVHVGAQPDGAPARIAAAADHRDDAGPPDSRVVLYPQGREPVADDLRGAMLLEAQLRMHVQVAAERRELGVPAADVGNGIVHERCQ